MYRFLKITKNDGAVNFTILATDHRRIGSLAHWLAFRLVGSQKCRISDV